MYFLPLILLILNTNYSYSADSFVSLNTTQYKWLPWEKRSSIMFQLFRLHGKPGSRSVTYSPLSDVSNYWLEKVTHFSFAKSISSLVFILSVFTFSWTEMSVVENLIWGWVRLLISQIIKCPLRINLLLKIGSMVDCKFCRLIDSAR